MKKTESESVVSYISLTDCNYIFYQKSHRAKVVMSIGIFITLVLNLMILYTSKSLSDSQCQNVSDKGIDAIGVENTGNIYALVSLIQVIVYAIPILVFVPLNVA